MFGLTFDNAEGLSKKELRWARAGIWPLYEADVAAAAENQTPFLASLSGFIHTTAACAVTSYSVDRAT